MIPVTILTDQGPIHVSYRAPLTIAQALRMKGLLIDQPCGGSGKCGKCQICASGSLSPITEKERLCISPSRQAHGYRLACSTFILGNATIDYTTKTETMQGITEGFFPSFSKDPLTGNKNCYGLAIDIGTTTIAGYLYHFPDCTPVSAACLPNTQSAYGGDVISRIDSAIHGGGKELQHLVRRQIESMVKAFGCSVDTFVITGNTVMLHLLTGMDPQGLASAPFTPKSLFGCWMDQVYFPPCISAYVGADITCSILSSNMQSQQTAFLVDIGTNGEMALWHDGKFICCSTAAGPALEGAGISMGMRAVPGAISKVWTEQGTVQYETIQNAPPTGICGSGLIDAAACMLSCGVLDETGYLEKSWQIGESGVFITPEDIRQLQLAKAAIRAGIDTLLSQCGIAYEQLESFYIAGGFGSFIDRRSAAAIGLIPKQVLPKVTALGNAAGSGAAMILQSRQCLAQASSIAALARAIDLSANPVFTQHYIENMLF